MTSLIKLASFILVLFLSACLEGWVISLLWGWFMVPTFGLPSLSIPLALGISLVISASRPPSQIADGKEIEHCVKAFLHPPMCLLIGFIVKTFFL
jgi:hypothetical protein